ncbi:putative ABC-class ATPase [Tamaricihabitans halophyticus]|uniref:Putative ABC-class ATPase n=1 Tax=Tamaricihabitans halophyticus TaxID=1262583 RepID=A0A4R2QDS4_9PSEU|nr:ABC-ATPase domain-containing protein [Tamaricihabitans halophyticus]TCP47212.1 putative ABC-class ATPase [Tamaricihabitans halophyticus]
MTARGTRREHGRGTSRQGGSLRDLAGQLDRLHGDGYGKYRTIEGSWAGDGYTVVVRKAQTDPFAPASRIEVRIPADYAGFPERLWAQPIRARALADYLLRELGKRLRGSLLSVDACGQEVLDRSALRVQAGAVTVSLGIDLPGPRRRIDGRGARTALCTELPSAIEAIRYAALDAARLDTHVDAVQDSAALRGMLADAGLVAFVADGAMLARRSGTDDRPLTESAGAIAFQSPESMRAEFELPNRGRVVGMGIGAGITLIVGGGFHGKSTLLRALERGVYDHIAGDGRELVVSRPSTVKIRAEDGRSVQRVDVSPFVGELPTGADTRDFSTSNASGSTSQAATTMEALEAGAEVLLIDEDTAATNLMIRDARMQALVAKDKEPLTPFVDLVRPLYREHGVSTVLVMGGSGDYLEVADRVLMMASYMPEDATDRARALVAGGADRRIEANDFPSVRHRVCDPASVVTEHNGRRKIKQRGIDTLVLGDSDVDLRAVEQLVDRGQVIGIGLALSHAVESGLFDGQRTLGEVLDQLDEQFASSGVAAVQRGYLGDFALPRRFEIAAALSRIRGLRVLPSASS